MRIAAGSLKPANPKLVSVLLQFVLVLSFPIVLGPVLLPLGVELLVERVGISGAPVCLALSVVECAAAVCLYRFVLTWQGSLLHAREQRILDIVTTKTE